MNAVLTLLRRLILGRGTLFTVFAGTNVLREAKPAVAGVIGLTPLEDEPAVRAYEAEFARIAGTRHAFSFASGRMALYAILEALGVGPGDEVMLPAFTCVVVPNAIRYRDARPVYVDIDPATFNIDVTQLEARITPRTKAIIAQHTFGLICDIDRINEIADRHHLAVLEDCAHSLGATHQNRPCGSLGAAAYFSTDHTKVINTGTGGMVTTNDESLAVRIAARQREAPLPPAGRVRALLALFAAEVVLLHPRIIALGRSVVALLWWIAMPRAFFLDELSLVKPTAYPYPARLSGPQARVGLSQLALLPENLAWRRQVAALYETALPLHGVHLEPGSVNHAFLRYTFLVENRQAWEAHLSHVLEMSVWFTSVVAGRERDLHEVDYEVGSCPRAEMVARHCVNLPTHPRVHRPERLVALLRAASRGGTPALNYHGLR